VSQLVYIIVGEPSGDILASRLLMALKKRDSNLSFAGIGGETMIALGFKSFFSISDLSVMGVWEVVPRLPLILKRRNQIVEDITQQQPNVIVTVDSWGFVRAVIKKLKKRGVGIPIVHYVAPQVWAWKKSRAPQAAKMFDRLMTLWPFELPYFEKYGLNCHFVGHPVVENVAGVSDDLSEFRERCKIPMSSTVLCVLPGSRHSEVKRLIPVFSRVVSRLHTQFPNLFLLIPTINSIAEEVEQAFAKMSVPHCIVRGQSDRYQAFRCSCFAIAASGTVTLELAACSTPHLIAYRFSRLTNLIAKVFVTAPYANLINILAQREVIPEFVLANCRSDLIHAKALELMCDAQNAQEQVKQAKQHLLQLQPGGTTPSQKAAEVIYNTIRTHKPSSDHHTHCPRG
jgi:lipid-A-disaccharide synthase